MSFREKQLIEEVFQNIANGDAVRATRTSLRLSRIIGDHLATAIFLKQLGHPTREIVAALMEDMPEHTDEAKKLVFQIGGKRWLEARKLTFSMGEEDGEPMEYLNIPLGELDEEVRMLEACVSEVLQKNDVETAGRLRLKIRAVGSVREKALNQCQAFASRAERVLRQREAAQTFLDQVQSKVANYFAIRSPEVMQKLEKAEELLRSSNEEDFSLLLTQIRRSIVAIADHFFPSEEHPVRCADGKERKLGSEQYLNRLEEFIRRRFGKSTSADLLKAEMDVFSVFMRRLNDLSSKGVHASATHSEARQGLLGLYLFLFNLIGKLEETDDQAILEGA